MDEAINKLREIGTQKIFEQTHISRANIEAILDQTFTGLSPVQVTGFISILEREYGVDLSGLKRRAMPETDDLSIKISVKVDDSKDEASRGRLDEVEQRSWKWLGALSLVVILLAVFMISGDDKDEDRQVEQMTSITPEQPADAQSVATDALLAAVEENATVYAEENETIVAEEEPEEEATPAPVARSFSIVPRARLWMGIIDLSSRKRTVEITKETVELNASKPWLLVFGHGHFDIENGDQALKFKRQSKIRVLYEDGLAREIDIEEYKARNRGRNW